MKWIVNPLFSLGLIGTTQLFGCPPPEDPPSDCSVGCKKNFTCQKGKFCGGAICGAEFTCSNGKAYLSTQPDICLALNC